MPEYPYTLVTNKLQNFLQKIPSMGVPDVVNTKWLPSVGFKSKNDRSIISIVKFIGFIDSLGKPTDRWKAYRDRSKAKFVMAQGIKDGYFELFRLYPDADTRSNEELRNFFSPKISGGDQVVSATVNTFKVLCSLADFSKSTNAPIETEAVSTSISVQPPVEGPVLTSSYKYQSGVTININIELSLPATTEKDVYENLFAALKKHLLPDESNNGN